jgi:hypothetical protein
MKAQLVKNGVRLVGGDGRGVAIVVLVDSAKGVMAAMCSWLFCFVR